MLDLLGLLRLASGADGLRTRAAASSGGVSIQNPRFSAILSATSAPAMGAADAQRITVLRLGLPVEDWPTVKTRIVDSLAESAAIRSALIRDTEKIASHAAEISDELQSAGTMTSREALTMGALSSGWAWWSGCPGDRVLIAGDRTEEDDAPEALLELLALRVRPQGGDGLSTLAALRKPALAHHVADAFGMRIEHGNLLIAPRHKGLQAALRRSRLMSTDLRVLLLQISRAEMSEHPRRFGGLRARAVVIPGEVLVAMGICVKTDIYDEDQEFQRGG